MNKLAVIGLCSLLMACSNGNTCTKVPAPSGAPTVEPAPKPVPEPKPEPEKIIWQPFDSDTRAMLQDTGYCAMILFSSNNPSCEECKMMEKTFEDPEVVTVVNDAFISVRFPVDECMTIPDCKDFLVNGLDIKGVPTTVLTYAGEDSVSLVGEGYMDVSQFKEYLFKNQDQYNECKSLKGN